MADISLFNRVDALSVRKKGKELLSLFLHDPLPWRLLSFFPLTERIDDAYHRQAEAPNHQDHPDQGHASATTREAGVILLLALAFKR